MVGKKSVFLKKGLYNRETQRDSRVNPERSGETTEVRTEPPNKMKASNSGLTAIKEEIAIDQILYRRDVAALRFELNPGFDPYAQSDWEDGKTATILADAIKANADAFYDGKIDHGIFHMEANRLWNEVRACGLMTEVSALTTPKFGGVQ